MRSFEGVWWGGGRGEGREKHFPRILPTIKANESGVNDYAGFDNRRVLNLPKYILAVWHFAEISERISHPCPRNMEQFKENSPAPSCHQTYRLKIKIWMDRQVNGSNRKLYSRKTTIFNLILNLLIKIIFVIIIFTPNVIHSKPLVCNHKSLDVFLLYFIIKYSGIFYH